MHKKTNVTSNQMFGGEPERKQGKGKGVLQWTYLLMDSFST